MVDTSKKSLESVVRSLVNRLANGDYEGLLMQCSNSRLTTNDLHQVIKGYGRTFIEPPPGAYSNLDAVVVRDAQRPTWSVRAPLWSKEEGQSDLTLEVTVIKDGDHCDIELQDLHVL